MQRSSKPPGPNISSIVGLPSIAPWRSPPSRPARAPSPPPLFVRTGALGADFALFGASSSSRGTYTRSGTPTACRSCSSFSALGLRFARRGLNFHLWSDLLRYHTCQKRLETRALGAAVNTWALQRNRLPLPSPFGLHCSGAFSGKTAYLPQEFYQRGVR